MQTLNSNMLSQVNGGFGPKGAVVGGALGAIGYLASAATSGEASFGGFAAAVGGGALSGFVGGGALQPMKIYLQSKVSFFAGGAAGLSK